MKNSFRFLLPLLAISLLLSCGGGGIQTQSNGNPTPSGNSPPTLTNTQSFSNGTVQLNALSLGQDFPPALEIPDIDGLRSTAFVVSFLPAVLAVDLDAQPLGLSAKFKGFDATTSSEVAFPNNLLILNPSLGLLMGTSDFDGTSAVVAFDPTTGQKIDSLNLSQSINLTQALPYSRPADCDGDNTTQSSIPAGPYTPNYAAAMAVAGSRLFVTMSDLCFDASGSVYTQGLVQVYDLHSSPPILTKAATPFFITAGYNATGLTVVGNHLLVTASGDTNLSGGISTPESDSYLTEIDPVTLQEENVLNLGKVALNFQPLAVTQDQSRGFIGSSTYSEVYEIDLDHFQALRGTNNPIPIYNSSSDFLSDQKIAEGDQVLFVSSFNNSAIRGVDLQDANLGVLPKILDFAFTGNPGTTGAGPTALRPGIPGKDFQGPDLWVLTSNPGTLSSATTY